TYADPPLQGIPHDAESRRCFPARPGRLLTAADYSQIELRLAAALAGDRAMLAAFAAGDDFHAATARELYPIPPDAAVREEHGAFAKMVNLARLCGSGAPSLHRRAVAAGLDVTEDGLRDLLRRHGRLYPAVARMRRRALDGTDPVLVSKLGRRRRWAE